MRSNFLRRSLIAVLLAEVGLFSASFGKYFCGDSLYFYSHPAKFSLFTQLDDLSTYRPLTVFLFQYLMLPLGGFHPLPYHVMALLGHMAVTVLVFLLLRRTSSSETGIVAGLVFFGLHSTGFYLSYDATFLPDLSVALFTAGAFLAFATGRRHLSLALYIAALLCKESAVAIPVGIAAIGYFSAKKQNFSRLLPFGLVTAAYLAFQFYLHHGWLYPSSHSAYQFTVETGSLWLKLKYLPWLFNLPADWARQGWWMIPAIVLMLPPLVWLAIRKLRYPRTERVICAIWLLAALAPALPVAQVPMKHNLYVPLIAVAVLFSRMLTAERRAGLAMACLFAAATAFHVRNDLKTSWVGEGSDITEASIEGVQRAYPVLPPRARFYILPATIPGGIPWYFDDEELFRRVYNDPGLKVYYGDLKRLPPPGSTQQAGLLIFAYHGGRLYDVTAEYKRAAADHDSRPLLGKFGVDSSLPWKASELLNGRAAGLTQLAVGDDLRQSLEILPESTVTITVDKPLPADAVLAVGFAGSGKQAQVARGEVAWVYLNKTTVLTRVFLEPSDGGKWWDGMLDLSPFAGQTGTLLIRNTGGREADWLAISRLAVIPRSSPFLRAQRGNDNLARLSEPLSWRFDESQVLTRIDWKKEEMPGGAAAARQWLTHAERRRSIVVLPATTVRIPVERISPESLLLVGVGRVEKQGAEAQGRVLWESAGHQTELTRVLLEPGEDDKTWWDDALDLRRFEGQSGALVLENSGGRESDWIAWNRLQIVPAGDGDAWVEAVARPLRERGTPLLIDFAKASITSSETWNAADLPGGHPASLGWLDRGGQYRRVMLMVPATEVRLPVTIPEHARLAFGLNLGGGTAPASEASIAFEGHEISHAYLDRTYDGGAWQPHEVDLDGLKGAGTLVFRNLGKREGPIIALSDVRIRVGPPSPPVGLHLFDLFAGSARSTDLTEDYPDHQNFGTPADGKPSFIWWDNKARPARLSLVTLAGAGVSYQLDALPERASLVFAVSHGTGAGDGVRGRISLDGHVLFDRMVMPSQRDWSEVIIPLPAQRSGRLKIEASSGPKGNTIGDWLAWSGLRIVPE